MTSSRDIVLNLANDDFALSHSPSSSSSSSKGGGGGGGRKRAQTRSRASRAKRYSYFCYQTLTGHKDVVVALAFAKDFLFSTSQDTTIKVWDLKYYKLRATMEGHTRSVLTLAVKDDAYLLSSSSDHTIKIWDISVLQCVGTITGFMSQVFSLSISNDFLYAGCQDTTIKMIHLGKVLQLMREERRTRVDIMELPELVLATKHHHSYVYDLLPNKSYLFSASGDSTIKVWEKDSMKEVKTLTGHEGCVLALVCDDAFLYSGSQDKTIKVWDLETFYLTRTIAGHHRDDILSLATSNLYLFSASADKSIKIFDKKDYNCLQSIKSGSEVLALVTRGPILFSADANNEVKIWDSFDIETKVNAEVSRAECRSKELTMIETLKNFVAIPTVSSDPSMTVECWKGARFLRQLLRYLGFESRLVQGMEGKNPVVLARTPLSKEQKGSSTKNYGMNQKPTITFYGHYDVVPAKDTDGWISPPFQLTGRDGYLYGRGVTDDKGPILALLFAVKEMLEELQGGCSKRVCKIVAEEGEGEDNEREDDEHERKEIEEEEEHFVLEDKSEEEEEDGEEENGDRELDLSDLPVNVVLVIEGEEENDSGGFRNAIQSNLDWFKGTDLLLFSNNFWLGEKTPCLSYGLRGVIQLAVTVQSEVKQDLHSGIDGGIIHEPMFDLITIFSRLLDSNGKIMIPGIYEDVATVTEEEERLYEGLEVEFNARLKRRFGIESPNSPLAERKQQTEESAPSSQSSSSLSVQTPHQRSSCLVSDSPKELLMRRWRQPALTIHSIQRAVQPSFHPNSPSAPPASSDPHCLHPALQPSPCLSSSPREEDLHMQMNQHHHHHRSASLQPAVEMDSMSTVIPRQVVGNISIRTVPNQKTDKVISLVTEFIEAEFKKLRSGNSLSIEVRHTGDWWLGDPNNDVFKTAEYAIRQVWKTKPVYIREGGTIPITSFLEESLKAPAIHLPLGQSTDAAHLPNERIRVENLLKGKNVIKLFLQELGKKKIHPTKQQQEEERNDVDNKLIH
ncbi:glutamine amidotransferase subunit [Balamuthia mandrillaris]